MPATSRDPPIPETAGPMKAEHPVAPTPTEEAETVLGPRQVVLPSIMAGEWHRALRHDHPDVRPVTTVDDLVAARLRRSAR